MVNFNTLRSLALSFPGTTEEPHFEKISFRVKGEIFATYDYMNQRACIKLSEVDQNVYSLAAEAVIYPVENSWGKQGWTLINMNQVDIRIFREALAAAYCEVAPGKLVDQFRSGTID